MSTQTLAPNTEKQQDSAVNAMQKKYEDKHLQELHDHRLEKKGARRLFHIVNFGGWHMLFNSTLSLFLTYNILTKKFAQDAVDWMSRSFIGKAAHTVFTLPGKAVDAGMSAAGMSLNGNSAHGKILTAAEKEAQQIADLRHSSRSSIEAMLMCIAGFVALFPVKWFEHKRAGFLNWADNLLHPGRTKEEKEAAKLKSEDEPKETWGNLLRARVIGVAAVFTVDRLQQNFNNWRMKNKKPTADAWSYRLGNYLYDKMPVGIRSWFAKFFSNKNVTLASIQPQTSEECLTVIKSPQAVVDASKEINVLKDELYKDHVWKNPAAKVKIEEKIGEINKAIKAIHPEAVERAVFAEQSRLLFTKELWLTLVVSVVIYTCAKAPFMAKIFEKIGLKKKEEHHKPEAPQENSAPVDTATIADSEDKKRWSEREMKKPSRGKAAAPAASFAEAAAQSSGPEASVSV